ncbi:MAG: hypothetical protein JWO30_327 [Fibrobacteres bacterium]|nr:hypothetical protein [Fibrobacterota bacterium]
MRNRIPRPLNIGQNEMWIDEAIWGHRLHDEQSPWLCFLEFLGVLYSEHKKGSAFVEAKPNTLTYAPQIQLNIRNILFNNPTMGVIVSETRNDQDRWTRWLERMNSKAANREPTDYSYLRNHFDSFDDFFFVVKFLRSSAIEGNSNKRWSSKFVFPYGPNCLYEDLNFKNDGFSNDRRFFGRTGEILYLMLCRSGKGKEILEKLAPIVFNETSKWNILGGILQGSPQNNEAKGGTYLPYEFEPEYGDIASDWLSVLNLRLPGYDALPHLVTLLGFHLIRYQLNQSRIELGEMGKATFIFEIVAPKKTIIRDLAAESFSENNSLPQQAIEKMIKDIFSTSEWEQAKSSNDPQGQAIKLLQEKFAWPNKQNETALQIQEPDGLAKYLVDCSLARHKQHLGKFHGTWGRLIGLSSRRVSRRTRYAPTDSFLKSLVVSNVKSRMEYQEFLRILFERYGIIIGEKQAFGNPLIQSLNADKESFADNSRRLEERLSSLGLLRRLSDACAYVENPLVTMEKTT